GGHVHAVGLHPGVEGIGAGAVAGAHRYQSSARAGDRPSADAFDAWMQANGVHVATGKPATPASSALPPAAAAAGGTDDSRPLVQASTPTPSPSSAASVAAAASQVQLQVASFSSRDNAQKALARLQAAGIRTASVSDIVQGGRTWWRLRVGADSTAADNLSGRIAALGFGQPQVVRE
ncbi:MAG: SPOR domain-containing protein, partial [Pseudoxanthomonas sp.]